MVTTRWLLPRVNTPSSKKLPRVKLKLAPHKDAKADVDAERADV
jgi:hypothetical protein